MVGDASPLHIGRKPLVRLLEEGRNITSGGGFRSVSATPPAEQLIRRPLSEINNENGELSFFAGIPVTYELFTK